MANADTRIKQTFKRELLLGLFSVTALAALVGWAFLHPEHKDTFRWLLPAIPGLAGAVMTSFWALGLVLKVRQYR